MQRLIPPREGRAAQPKAERVGREFQSFSRVAGLLPTPARKRGPPHEGEVLDYGHWHASLSGGAAERTLAVAALDIVEHQLLEFVRSTRPAQGERLLAVDEDRCGGRLARAGQ